MKVFFAGLFLIFLTGCETTGIFIKESPKTVTQIRQAVAQVMGTPRFISENGRELISVYYDKNQITHEPDQKVKDRYYTKVVILGERRPYDIQVDVIHERITPGLGFEIIDHNDSIATKIARKIKDRLDQSREDSNVIDDFRAF